MMITMIIVTVLGAIAFGLGFVAFNAAFHDRARARVSHVAAQEAKMRADEYRSAGREMFKSALASYEEGQEDWQAAPVALLDAKRREAKAEEMLEKVMKHRGLRSVNGQTEIMDRKEAV